MIKLAKIAALCVVVLLVASPAWAQTEGATEGTAGGGTGGTAPAAAAPAAAPALTIAAFGAGLIIIGAGYGIGKIGSCAVESMARQPEVAGSIQSAMIISAALIEGATFFALIVCIIK